MATANRECIEVLRQLLTLKKYKIVMNEDGSIVPPKAKVFAHLSEAIGKSDPLKPKTIYTILKLNRYQMHTYILKYYNIAYQTPIPINTSLDDSGYVNPSFTLDVTNIWREIETEAVSYNCKKQGSRRVRTLKRRFWTNYLFDEIFERTKINCPLTFKRNKTSESGYAVTVEGFCPECDCVFNGYVANKPIENESIIMECCLQYYDPLFSHAKKRQLKGSKRIEVGKELVEGKTLPCIWRRKEADRLMDYNDTKEPPHLFNGSVLSKVKQERQDHFLGIKSENTFDSILLLKYDLRSEGAIRSIGLDPLNVHYFTNEQISVFEKHHKTVMIDSTGSLMKKVKLPNRESSPHIFLYQCVTKIENSTHVPICQMVSAVQNTNAIAYWLFEFLRIGSTHKSSFPVPKEVVTDFNRALLGGVVRAFAKKNTLAEYLSHCFNLLIKKESAIPHCLLRLDICHFMNMVAKWKCWSKDHKRVKQFYLRSFAALREQNSLEGIEKHAKAIFIVSLNENQVCGNSTDRARNCLTDSIRGVDIDDKYLDSSEHDTDFDDNNEFLATDNIFQWATNLLESCTKEIATEKNTEEINAYHCPEVAKNLKALLPYFPLFSDVMPLVFGYGSKRPTSAAVESEFNDLKNRILKDVSTPIRVDKFVSHHLSSFPGKLKIGLAKQTSNDEKTDTKNTLDELQKLNYESIDFSDTDELQKLSTEKKNENNNKRLLSSDDDFDELHELRQEENWRNKNGRKIRPKYVDKMPQFDPTLKSTNILPVIVNGTYCKNVHLNKQIFVLKNTCAFDSICQILATVIRNDPKYREIAKESHIPILKTALILVENGLKTEFYNERAQLLYDLPVYNAEKGRTNIKIDANINIGNLAVSLFSESPSCAIITKCLTCDISSSTRNYATISANLNILKEEGFHKLEQAIENNFPMNKKCCGALKNDNKNYGPHLLIETDLGQGVRTPIKDIPLELNMSKSNKYKLAGVVAYYGSFKRNLLGHYTAFVPVLENWIEFNNLLKKEVFYKNDVEIHAHLCVYTLN